MQDLKQRRLAFHVTRGHCHHAQSYCTLIKRQPQSQLFQSPQNSHLRTKQPLQVPCSQAEATAPRPGLCLAGRTEGNPCGNRHLQVRVGSGVRAGARLDSPRPELPPLRPPGCPASNRLVPMHGAASCCLGADLLAGAPAHRHDVSTRLQQREKQV